MCLFVIGGEISPKTRWFFFFVVATRLFCTAMCSITAKQHNCRFLVLKRNIQNKTAGFALLTVVETSCFFLVEIKPHFSILHVAQYTSPIVFMLSTHNSFFPYLIDWNVTLSRTCLSGTNFFSKEKTFFVCFCRLYVLL